MQIEQIRTVYRGQSEESMALVSDLLKSPNLSLRDLYAAQFDNPYQCTIKFEAFLNEHACFQPNETYLDIGAGYACVTHYFANKHPSSEFVGLDYNPEIIASAAVELDRRKILNLTVGHGDWFDLPKKFDGKFEGIFNNHTLCVFKDFKGSVGKLLDLNPRWVAFNSLFWDGYLDTYIHTKNSDYCNPYDDTPDADFNICSIPTITEYFKSRGYLDVFVQPFEIDLDLARPKDGRRATYTVKTEWGPRTQFSGPIHLPWHFVLAKR